MTALFQRRIILVVLSLLFLVPAPSWAEMVGTFTRVEGSVDLLPVKGTTAIPANTGDAVMLGDAVRTKRGGKAEIRFRDDSVIQLAPETRITIDQYSFRSDGSREKGFLNLFRGKLRAVVAKIKASVVTLSLTDSSFNVKTPTSIAGVKGTDLIVYYERGVSGIIFLDGSGFALNPARPGTVVPVDAGQATFVTDPNEPPMNAVPVSREFVAPHIRDTSAGMLYAATTDVGTGRQALETNVTAGHTTYAALTDQGSAVAGLYSGVTSAPPAAVTTTAGPIDTTIIAPPAITPPPPPPVTQKTPVTLRVNLP